MTGFISLVFDDGYEHILNEIVPTLDRLNLPGVFAIPLQEAWTKWLPLRRRGHEIAAHSVSHVDLTHLTGESLDRELREPQIRLNATTLIYPGGAVNDSICAQAAIYYHAARTVSRGLETIPPRDPLRLKTFNWSQRNWSLWKANLLALYAVVTGRWLIETFHAISDAPQSPLHTVPRREFIRHISFLKRLGLPVKTIKAVIP